MLWQKTNPHNLLVAPLMGFPGTILTGSTVAANLADGKLQFATIAALYERFRPDFVFPLMDLTVESEAAGALVRMQPNESPHIEGVLVRDRSDLERLSIPALGSGNRLGVFVETAGLLVKNLPADPVKCGYIMGPFSLAGRLMGTEAIALNIVLDPEFVHQTLRYCLALLQRYAAALLATGLDCLWILEPTASLVSPSQAEEFSNHYIRSLIGLARAAGRGVVLHNCGRIDHLLPAYAALDLDGLSVGSVQDPVKTKDALPAEMTLFGNLDPARIFLASPTIVREETQGLLAKMKDRSNFVPASGCDLPPATPLESIEAFVAVVREHGRSDSRSD